MPKGDREILKADPDDGTTPIANLLLEALAIAKLTGKEKGAIAYLWRKTYGWQKNGVRLKEARISLQKWATILNTDKPHASSLLSRLEANKIFFRKFIGPGKGYRYSMNTTVANWGNGCINRQLLQEIATEGLPESPTVGLPKTATPIATNPRTLKKLKESAKEISTGTHIEENEYDKQIADLERQLENNSLPIWQRKKIKEEIKEIRRSDPNKYKKGKYAHMVQR